MIAPIVIIGIVNRQSPKFGDYCVCVGCDDDDGAMCDVFWLCNGIDILKLKLFVNSKTLCEKQIPQNENLQLDRNCWLDRNWFEQFTRATNSIVKKE